MSMMPSLNLSALHHAPPEAAALSGLWKALLARLSRQVFPYFLLASVLFPVGVLVLAFHDERLQDGALYFAPAVLALVVLAAYAWRRHADLAITVDERTRALSFALSEREQLLKEVHHRVKNNMQIISSLIRMQDRVGTSPDETIRRVQAMALVHDLIYTQGEFASVDLAAYTASLCETLRSSGGDRTAFDLTIEPVTVALDRAMPFALILSEVVTNAIKHALQERTGSISITLNQKDGVAKLVVSDNGRSLNPEVDGRGFGLRLVESLATQLDAVTTFERQDGTVFQMTFQVG